MELTSALLDVLRVTGLQLVQLFGLLFGLGLGLHLLEQGLFRLHRQVVGHKGAIYTTGWLGTPLHELGHLLFCPLFGHKVERFSLFQPDEQTGTLGYVKHSYNPRNPWAQAGQLFIGFGPLLLGSTVIFLLLWALLPDSVDALGKVRRLLVEGGFGATETFRDIAAGAVLLAGDLLTLEHLKSWQFWVFVYLTMCIATHMGPSRPDLKGGLWGFLLWAVALLTLNLVSVLVFDTSTGPLVRWIWGYVSWLAALFLLAAAVALGNLIVTWVVLAAFSLLTEKPLPRPWG